MRSRRVYTSLEGLKPSPPREAANGLSRTSSLPAAIRSGMRAGRESRSPPECGDCNRNSVLFCFFNASLPYHLLLVICVLDPSHFEAPSRLRTFAFTISLASFQVSRFSCLSRRCLMLGSWAPFSSLQLVLHTNTILCMPNGISIRIKQPSTP
jgi:hypothetical protein